MLNMTSNQVLVKSLAWVLLILIFLLILTGEKRQLLVFNLGLSLPIIRIAGNTDIGPMMI